MRSLCIYEWKAWHGFLLPMIFPQASRLRVEFGESSPDLLRRLPPNIETFAFYVNLTDTRLVPFRRAAFCRSLRRRGIRILNEHVTDVSKHRVQAACAHARLNVTKALRRGDPDELLIVKTSANYGGEKEGLLSPQQRQLLGLRSRRKWINRHDGYLIMRRDEIRPEFWKTPEIIVERFVENKH